MRYSAVLILLAGCSVVNERYPPAWELPAVSTADCRRFSGTYADRGESAGRAANPSLTRELLGEDGPWARAKSVRLDIGADETIEVTVNPEDAAPFVQRFSAKTGDYRCEGGKLMFRTTRWITSGLMSGRERVKIELHEADRYLIAHVEENTTGVMFMVVPLAGESVRWFRFPRLQP